MPRYFIDVAYKGTDYSGFQIQQNANSVQEEVTKAMQIFFKKDFNLTGSSRTDSGVHALQNYFHFDLDQPLNCEENDFQYNLNALLPKDIVINKIFPVKENSHCRFDAISREYKYYIYQKKDPFIQDFAFYYPYQMDLEKLVKAGEQILLNQDFTTFSKKNTQVNDFYCEIKKSEWFVQENTLVYNVIGNRFLRGMVKGLVGTMLRAGTNKISLDEFSEIIKNKDSAKADFSPPSHGLFLIAVKFDSSSIALGKDLFINS